LLCGCCNSKWWLEQTQIKTVVPPLWLQMLKAARKNLRRVHDLTIYQFYRELAKLGGFLGCKSDGESGWITIWRGGEKLNTLVEGAKLARKLKNVGKDKAQRVGLFVCHPVIYLAASIASWRRALGWTPTKRSTTSPFLKTISVGMLLTP